MQPGSMAVALALQLSGVLIRALARPFRTTLLAVCCTSLWAPVATAEDYQFRPAAPVRDAAEKLLTDITRAGDRLVAVGERGLVILSDDDGQSWQQATVPVSATLTAVDFATDQLGWAVGHAGTILHSKDGGATWTLQFDGNEANRQWLGHATEQRKALEAQVEALQQEGDPDGMLADLEYDLEDAQFNEEDAQAAIETGPADPMLDVLFTSASEGWAVGAYGMVYRTSNGGENWQLAAASIDNPDRYHFYAIAADNQGNLFLSGEAGLLYHSHDGGQTWTRNDDVYIGSLFGVAVQGERIYTFGLRGNIFRSDDRGVTWNAVPNPTEFSLYGGKTLRDGRLLLVGAGGGVITFDLEGRMSSSVQASRATLSSLVQTSNGKTLLVGMAGIELEEGPSG